MNGSQNIKRRRVPAFMAMLFGALFVMLLPVYGQQEIDPTWYDPWVAPNALAGHSSQPQASGAEHHAKVKPASSVRAAGVRVAGKVRAKKSAIRPHSS
jgi:hypothetical protein